MTARTSRFDTAYALGLIGLLFSVDVRCAVAQCTTAVLNVANFSGADLGARINGAAAAAIYSNLLAAANCGVTLDARAFTGIQNAAAPIYLGNVNVNTTSKPTPTYPMTLLLGPVRFYVHQITLGPQSSIQGTPTGLSTGKPPGDGGVRVDGSAADNYQDSDRTGYTQIIAATNSALESVVRVGMPSASHVGDQAAIRDVVIEGNRPVAGAATNGIHVYDSGRVDLKNVVATGNLGDGILATSVASGSLILDHVVAIANGSNGLHLVNTNDAYVSQFESNGNGVDGILLDASSAFRIIQSDISQNLGVGLHLVNNSYNLNLTGTQFNGNHKEDLRVDGTTYGNIVSSNVFQGQGCHLSGNFSVIYFNNAAITIVSHNVIAVTDTTACGGTVQRNYAGIHFPTNPGGTAANVIVGNTFRGLNLGASPPTPTSGCPIVAPSCP